VVLRGIESRMRCLRANNDIIRRRIMGEFGALHVFESGLYFGFIALNLVGGYRGKEDLRRRVTK